MNQASRQVQTQSQQQVQTLSPQQVLTVRLLELPALELEDRVRAELLENPALEEGREASDPADTLEEPQEANLAEDGGEADYDAQADYRDEDEIPDYYTRDNNSSADNQPREIPYAEATSFYEQLKEQLGEQALDEKQRQLAEYLIGSLDDDGLLRKSLESLSDELAIYSGIEASSAELEEVLKVIQQFDPPGVGARTLQECLLIQLRRKRMAHEEPPQLLLNEERIITQCYDEFTRKHWDKIAQLLELSDKEVAEAVEEIKRLNPRPGASLGETIGRNMQQIVPDFIVESDDEGRITLTLNDGHMPELRISPEYRRLVSEQTPANGRPSREQKEAMLFLKQKIDAAQGFINAIIQRQRTLALTMQAIIDLQRPFFVEGDESLLRPMILKDVAERTHLDPSTISRVSNSKYVQTNFGIYPLKFFFNDSFVTDEGEELSIREIKKCLQEIVQNEDKSAPLVDQEICAQLQEKGYPVSRRTVAKYREQLNIPVARLRK